ncbi:MAG: hypothetical protein WC464_04340 [Bdellovibrionales bacterium]
MTLAQINSFVPLWVVFGLLAAFLSSSQMLLQEKFKGAPFAMAFWNKVVCALVMLPFVIATGLPTNPFFYTLLAIQALMWVISDVVFFRGINEVGAGVVSRLLPIGTLISFFLWFAFDFDLAAAYAKAPAFSLAIVFVFSLSAFFAWHMRSCPVTRKAIRVIWFTLFATVAGTIFTKIITQQTDADTGVFGYIFAEALIMITMWLVYYAIKRPLPANVMFGIKTAKAGLAVGTASAFTIAAYLYALYNIDNPAYVTAVRHLNAVMIFFIYRATGRPNDGKLWAGFGIVACVAALIVLKAQI